jgi:hypothetical protein
MQRLVQQDTASATANSGARLPSVEVTTARARGWRRRSASVSSAGKNRPMATKIGRPRQTTARRQDQRRQQQEQQREGGTLIAAPDSGSTVRKPNCARTTPAPEEGRSERRKRMAEVMRSVLVPSEGAVARSGHLAVFGALPIRFRRFSTPPDFHSVMPAVPGIHSANAGCRDWQRFAMPGMTNGGTTMATHKLLLLPGDGIGPEVMGEVQAPDRLAQRRASRIRDRAGLVGGSAYDAHKVSISEATWPRRRPPTP